MLPELITVCDLHGVLRMIHEMEHPPPMQPAEVKLMETSLVHEAEESPPVDYGALRLQQELQIFKRI